MDHFYFLLLFASFPQLSILESPDSVPEEVMERIGEIVEEGGLCRSPVDVILALDASGSVLKENWKTSVDFAGRLAEKILALNVESRIGVIDFSQVANEAIKPSNDQAVLKQGLENLKNWYQNGITRTELALNKATEMFTAINRESAKQLLAVVTDGPTTPLNGMVGLELLKAPTENLKATGVHVTAVGVGTLVNNDELHLMSTDNENVLHADNYEHLLTMVDTIFQKVCEANNTGAVPTSPPSNARISNSEDSSRDSTCPAVYTKIGCFRDDMRPPRPLPELLFTDRDPTVKKYSNIPINWANWNSYAKDLVCRCAKEARVRNYPYFSIQFYGECWSGPEVADTYHRTGPVDTCISRDYKKCDPSDPTECVGKQETNFVYGVELPAAEPACKVTYHKLGCYKDNQKNPRPLPRLLQTDRDRTSSVYSEITIDWGKWDPYIADLVCRCAEKAAEKNYRYFGLQFFGECWSGADDEIQYDKIGRKDDKCVTRSYKTCDADPGATDMECVGTQRANYVYGITKTRDASCSVPFKLVDCYKDLQKQNGRPLPELLFTDRDKKSKIYSGIPIDWGKWDAYIEDLVCRCSQAAKEKQYSHFGIQYYGECWSGPEAGDTFMVDGTSKACVGKKFDVCIPESTCAGKAKANAVYSI